MRRGHASVPVFQCGAFCRNHNVCWHCRAIVTVGSNRFCCLISSSIPVSLKRRPAAFVIPHSRRGHASGLVFQRSGKRSLCCPDVLFQRFLTAKKISGIHDTTFQPITTCDVVTCQDPIPTLCVPVEPQCLPELASDHLRGKGLPSIP